MKITGKCHCGEIRYEAEIDVNMVGICHCTDCQILSGSAFRTIVITVSDKFKLIAGELKSYVKTAESGTKEHKHFVLTAVVPFTPHLKPVLSIVLGQVP